MNSVTQSHSPDNDIGGDLRHWSDLRPEAPLRSVVIYESMFGNTHVIAEHVAEGLRDHGDATVLSVHDVGPDTIAGVDLVVVGAPTHVHGLPRESSRDDAVSRPEHYGDGLQVEPSADEPGLREWFATLDHHEGTSAAAFDTRVDMAAVLSGRASKSIAKELRHHGFDLVGEPTSFLVDKGTHLVPGEDDRARAWGRTLGATR